MENAKIEKINEEIEIDKKVYYYSNFNFLMGHNGLRIGRCHGLIGTSGSGKSSLLKSIILENAKNMHKSAVWLSEETKEDYAKKMVLAGAKQEDLNNIFFLEEKKMMDTSMQNISAFHDLFNYKMVQLQIKGIKLLFIDNITTSSMYSEKAGLLGQEKMANIFSQWAQKGMSLLWLAHTGKNIRDNAYSLVGTEDVRGNNKIAMQTEYYYAMTKISFKGKQANILQCTKFRHHEKAAGYYLLVYEKGNYTTDVKLDFMEIKNILQNRDTFGGK